MLNALLAIVLASAGLAVIGYLGGVLWQAALGPLAGTLEKGRLRRCEARVAQGDAALRDGKVAEALDAFGQALYSSPVKSASMAAAVEKHHTGLLSRFIAASDRRRGDNIGLLSLAIVDRVLRKRKALQSSYIAALQTENGKRRRALARDLRRNSAELHKAVADLAAEVLRGEADAPGTLH